MRKRALALLGALLWGISLLAAGVRAGGYFLAGAAAAVVSYFSPNTRLALILSAFALVVPVGLAWLGSLGAGCWGAQQAPQQAAESGGILWTRSCESRPASQKRLELPSRKYPAVSVYFRVWGAGRRALGEANVQGPSSAGRAGRRDRSVGQDKKPTESSKSAIQSNLKLYPLPGLMKSRQNNSDL